MADIKIGCTIITRKGDSVLLGKRINCYGAGTWALPGGHLEYKEKLVDGACREAKEEMDADIAPSDLKLVSIVDDVGAEGDEHHIQVSFELLNPGFEPVIMEPDRCEEWRYFPLDELPRDNFFPPHEGAIENYLQQRLYTT